MSVQLLSIKEVGERLGISPRTVNRMLVRGEIQYLQMGGVRRIDLRDLERFVHDTKALTVSTHQDTTPIVPRRRRRQV